MCVREGGEEREGGEREKGERKEVRDPLLERVNKRVNKKETW